MFFVVNLVGLAAFSFDAFAQDAPDAPVIPAPADDVDAQVPEPAEVLVSEPIAVPNQAPTVAVTPAPTDASAQPSAGKAASWRFTLATELGGMAMSGSEIYNYGFGGSLIVGMQRQAWSFEALLLGSYSLQAKGALNAAYTDGSGKLFGIMARRRLAALPLSIAGGIGGSRLPVLRPPSAAVTAVPTELMIRAIPTQQLGVLVDGRYDVARSRRGNLFVGARVFVPLLTAIPPTHYQPTGPAVGTTTPVRTTAQDGRSFALTIGFGFEILFGD